MSQKKPASKVTVRHPSPVRRHAFALSKDVVRDAEDALHELRRADQRFSLSAFVEVAMRELLKAPDLGAVLRRHGASARRSFD